MGGGGQVHEDGKMSGRARGGGTGAGHLIEIITRASVYRIVF